MKILISASYYSPHISGLTNSIKNLAELLADHGYDIRVLTTQHKKDLPLKATIHDVKVKRVPYLLKVSKGFVMPEFLLAAWKEVSKTDQVIINLPQPEGFIIAVLAKMLGKKVHCIYACDVTLGSGLLSKVLEHALRGANVLALFFADSVITLTEDFKKKLPVSDAKLSQVKVIPPVILKPEVRLLRHFTPRNDGKYRIGFIGRIAAEKGIEYLLGAIPFLKKELPDFEIVFAGPKEVVGEKNYLEKMHALLEKEKNHIVQMGELKDDELGAFYASLDVLVLPSINSTEAFGMVQVEAMFCGTPVVASDLPGVRVPVGLTGMGEIAKPKDSADIAAKLLLVLKNRKEYIKSKREVEKVFDKEKILREYKKMFGEN